MMSAYIDLIKIIYAMFSNYVEKLEEVAESSSATSGRIRRNLEQINAQVEFDRAINIS